MIFHRQDIFDCDWDPEKRLLLARDAVRKRFIGRIRLRERIRFIAAQKGLDASINPLDLLEAGLHDLASGNLATIQFSSEFGDGELVQHEKRVSGSLEPS